MVGFQLKMTPRAPNHQCKPSNDTQGKCGFTLLSPNNSTCSHPIRRFSSCRLKRRVFRTRDREVEQEPQGPRKKDMARFERSSSSRVYGQFLKIPQAASNLHQKTSLKNPRKGKHWCNHWCNRANSSWYIHCPLRRFIDRRKSKLMFGTTSFHISRKGCYMMLLQNTFLAAVLT